ncbi:MAG: GTPase ObgE [Clostridia bacterium]|nr:GTPase ObgE [Clostridia bacterium]
MGDKSFTDVVRITIKSGNGGDGMCSFQSFKGRPAMGPDGGDGGSGGNVYVEGDASQSDFLAFRYKTKYAAGNGMRGGSKNCTGRSGDDCVIKVPLGTMVRDEDSGTVIADILEEGEKKLICEGGKGGKGNARFCTAKRHAPHFSQKGETTEVHALVLELKIIADVGIIGFPNVGKSTLLSKVSAARPKIADYHFTTLSPNLGVVRYYDNSFVAADIPGLIEGAAEGAGLGHDFLRHIERTRMLLHVIDVSGSEERNPEEDFVKINRELKGYSDRLASLPQIIVLNKCDIPGARENAAAFRKKYGKKYNIIEISALTGEGTDELLRAVWEKLCTLPRPSRSEEVDEKFSYRKEGDLTFEIFIDDDGAFVVEGTLVDMLKRNVVLSDPSSAAYFERVLRLRGVIDKLIEMGVKEGDTVVVGDTEFEYVP